MLAQTNSISGIVSDVDGTPLPGVNVLVVGTTNGTQTDFDGNYSISAKQGDVLRFSYIGMKTADITVANSTTINVSMEEDASQLDEVVVTGYGSQAKRDITGSVAIVDAEDLLAIPASTFAQQLQGRAAGITIVNDATPGGEATVRIRGFGTMGNNSPLYIIDGVPSTSQSNLNPSDIESLQILKDASAASIYGSRAANGVIIITTKKGKLGKPTITYSTYYGTQSTAEDVEVLNAKELGTYLYLADLYAGKTPAHGQYTFGANGEIGIPDYVFPSGASEGDAGTAPGDYALIPGNIHPITRSGDTNWWNEVTRSAPIKNHNISASGATENARYAFSLGYFSQDAVVKFNGYERISLRVNTEFKTLNNKLTIGENFTVSYDKKKGVFNNDGEQNAVSGSYKHHPLLPVFDITGHYSGSRGANLGNNFNPFAVIARGVDNRRHRLRAFGNVFTSYQITDDFKFKTSFGVDINATKTKSIGRPQPEYVEGSFVNSSTSAYSDSYQWQWSNVLSYDKTFNDVHVVNAYVGIEAIEEYGEYFGASRQRFAFESLPIISYLDLGDATTASNYGNISTDYSLFSYFGKFNYAYDGKYLGQFIIRKDKSSRFLQATQSAIFPAFSLGWRISDEDFFQNALPFVDDMKLRYGWGKTGNQEIDDYNAYTTYRSSIFAAGYPIDGSNSSPRIGFDVNKFGNPQARWEGTTSTNIGIDAALLDNKVTFNLDLWKRVTTDMLFQVPVTFTAGDAGAPSFNVGEITNKGIDLGIGFSDKKGDFGYSISANLSAYKNNVDRLDESPDTRFFGRVSRVPALTITEAGLPISSYYGYKTVGIFQSQAEADAWPTYGSYNAPGKFKVADINGDGVINDDDRTIIGNPHPDFTYGINLDFTYKIWSLNIFGAGSQGNDVYNYVRYFSDFNTFQGNKSRRALFDAWQPANPTAPVAQWTAANPGATAPIPDANDQISSRPSSYFIEDGSYFRIKNIQLTCDIPESVLKTVGISGAQIYIQAQNMFTFTKYSGLNPEVQTNNDTSLGFDGGFMPVAKTVMVGLNVKLY